MLNMGKIQNETFVSTVGFELTPSTVPSLRSHRLIHIARSGFLGISYNNIQCITKLEHAHVADQHEYIVVNFGHITHLLLKQSWNIHLSTCKIKQMLYHMNARHYTPCWSDTMLFIYTSIYRHNINIHKNPDNGRPWPKGWNDLEPMPHLQGQGHSVNMTKILVRTIIPYCKSCLFTVTFHQ